MWLASLLYWSFLTLTATGFTLLDTQVFYGPAAALELILGLTDEQRLVYVGFNLADFGFVFVYSAMLVTWVRFLRNRGALSRRMRPVYAILPGVLDLAENVAVALLLRGFHEPVWAGLAAVATPLKWLSGALLVSVLGWGEVRWRKFIRVRRRAARQVASARRAR